MSAERALDQFRIEKYGRFWKLMDGEDLVAVIVYKKGATEVKRRLSLQKSAGSARSRSVT